jgi:hypothetical protein
MSFILKCEIDGECEEKQSGVKRARISRSLCFVAPTGIEPVSKV